MTKFLKKHIAENMDSWQSQNKTNTDNSAPLLSVFVDRELESIEAALTRVVERELFWSQDVPLDNSDPEGSEFITYKRLGRYGLAKWINGSSNDLPSVGNYMEEDTLKVHSFGVSFGWDYFKLLNAAKANFPLQVEEAEAARMAANDFLNDVTYYGAQAGLGAGGAKDMFGLVNNPDVTVYNLPAGATTGLIPWADKNADEIEKDIANIIGIGQDATKRRFFTNGMSLMLPPAAYRKLQRKITFNDSSYDSLLDLILKGGWGITEVKARYELETAAIDGGGRAILYHNNSDVVRIKVPHMPKALYDMQNIEGLRIRIPFVARTGGVQFRLPMAAIYIDGIS